MTPAPSGKAAELLDFVRRGGGRLVVSTTLRVTVIDARAVAAFDKAGIVLLREDGEGYRLRSGKSSVYLFAGQLLVDGEFPADKTEVAKH